MIASDRLDAVSRSFLAFVAARRPGWLAHARLHERAVPGGGFVEIELPPPGGGNADTSFIISTDGEETTIYFGPHHSHIAAPDPDDPEGWVAVLDEADAILTEAAAVVSVWRADRLRFSHAEAVSELGRYREQADGDHLLRVQSWRGTYDRAVPVAWPGILNTCLRRDPA